MKINFLVIHFLTITFISVVTVIEAVSGDNNLCVGYYQSEEKAALQLQKFAALYSDKKGWERRAEIIRNGIIKGAELDQIPKAYRKAEFNPIISAKKIFNGYSVQNIAIDGMPGDKITGNLYMPLEKKDKYAIVLCPHGHWFAPDNYSRFRADMQKRCAAFARMGAVVYTYDMIGFGESTNHLHNNPKTLQFQIFNSMRVLDYMLSQKYADKDNVAVTGASGGGTQTILLAALDNRVKVSIPVVMVSAHFFGGCVCESGMPIHKSENHETNNVEIAALFAPKPMLLISDGHDWTKNTPRVEFPYIRNIYNYYDAADNIKNVHFPNEYHNYGFSKRKAAYQFLAEHLQLDYSKILDKDGNIDEGFITLQSIEDLKVFKDKPIMFLIDWDYHLSEAYEGNKNIK